MSFLWMWRNVILSSFCKAKKSCSKQAASHVIMQWFISLVVLWKVSGKPCQTKLNVTDAWAQWQSVKSKQNVVPQGSTALSLFFLSLAVCLSLSLYVSTRNHWSKAILSFFYQQPGGVIDSSNLNPIQEPGESQSLWLMLFLKAIKMEVW